MRPLPGHLPSSEIAALLEPYESFRAFAVDPATLRIVTDLVELSHQGHALSVFNYIHTMGAGGGAMYGESGWRVLTARLRGEPRPPLLLRRRGFGATLRHLFGGKVSVDGPAEFARAYLVVADDAEGARRALPPELLAHLGRARPLVDIEVRGHHLVAWCRGTVSGDAQRRFIEETAPVVPLFERDGYRT